MVMAVFIYPVLWYSVSSHNLFMNQMQWGVHCKDPQPGFMGISSDVPPGIHLGWWRPNSTHTSVNFLVRKIFGSKSKTQRTESHNIFLLKTVLNYCSVILNRGSGNIYEYKNIKADGSKTNNTWSKSSRRDASQMGYTPAFIWDTEMPLCSSSAFVLQLNKHILKSVHVQQRARVHV